MQGEDGLPSFVVPSSVYLRHVGMTSHNVARHSNRKQLSTNTTECLHLFNITDTPGLVLQTILYLSSKVYIYNTNRIYSFSDLYSFQSVDHLINLCTCAKQNISNKWTRLYFYHFIYTSCSLWGFTLTSQIFVEIPIKLYFEKLANDTNKARE